MTFQLLLHRKSSEGHHALDSPNDWMRLRERMAIDRAPSRQLAWWRKMFAHKVPVDPCSLQPDHSLRLPRAEPDRAPKRWGPLLCTVPIYLLGLLRRTRHLQVTDPRDRVIALWNLAIDFDDDGSPPSYHISIVDHYVRLAMLLPWKCNSLQFLPQCKLRRKPNPDLTGLPSWAPDWGHPSSAEYFWLPFRAAGDLPMHPFPFQQDMEDNIFHARGFLYNKVKQTLSQRDNALVPLPVIRDLFLSIIGASPDVDGILINLAQTLTGPSIGQLGLSSQFFSTAEKKLYMLILLCYSSITPGVRTQDLLSYASGVYEYCRTTWTVSIRKFRRVCGLSQSMSHLLDFDHLTALIPNKVDRRQKFSHFIILLEKTLSSGCLGSSCFGQFLITEGKAAVEPGDEIWILFGCPTPMLLRRKPPHFVVVSPAYIHDIMNGEAVNGFLKFANHNSNNPGKTPGLVANISLY